MIEKRRRDRMNRSLNILLDLIPHKKPEVDPFDFLHFFYIKSRIFFQNQRRIEKTEIIEMAVKYIRNLKTSNQKSSKYTHFFLFLSYFILLVDPIDLNKRSNMKIDTYSSGYHNGAYDTCEYIEKHFNNDTLISDLIHYIKEKEVALKDLTGSKLNKFIFIQFILLLF